MLFGGAETRMLALLVIIGINQTITTVVGILLIYFINLRKFTISLNIN